MSQFLKPGQHLDADRLSAFVEHALPEHERLASLAHLAECSHCRQIVFLTQQAEQEVAPLPRPATSWRRWFTYPPVLSLAAAALACVLIVVIPLRFHRVPQAPVPATTAMVNSLETLPANSPVNKNSITFSNPLPVPEKPRPRAKTIAPEFKSMPLSPLFQTPQGATEGSLAGVKSLQQPAASPSLVTPTIAGAASYAPLTHGIDTSKIPLSEGQNLEPRQQVHSQQSAFATPTPLALPAAETSRMSAIDGSISPPRTSNQTVEVAAESAQIQTEGANSRASFMLRSNAHKAYRTPLPSNLPAVANVSNGRQTVAADLAGALFLSTDAGRHWTPVVQQWLGKAVRLSLAISALPLPAPTKQTVTDLGTTAGQASRSQPSKDAGPGSVVLLARGSGFQLTTDLGGVWTSEDGITWKPR